MEYSVDTIVKDVLLCMDNEGLNDAEYANDSDNQAMQNVIKSKIADAIRFVFMNADMSMLNPEIWSKTDEDKLSGEKTVGGISYYSAKLPDKFLRLCYASMDDWARSVTEPILYSDKEYATLRNVITTGYNDNPKVALVIGSDGKYLEMYPSGSNAKIAYMQEPEMIEKPEDATETEGATKTDYPRYDIPEKVYRGVVYYTAGLTFLTFKDSHADSLMNQAVQMIGAK